MNNRAVLASLHALLHGKVQGVFFRGFVYESAIELGVKGWVRNLPDGVTVEICAEGERASLQNLLTRLHQGPPWAQVESIETQWENYSGKFDKFEVIY